MRCLERLAGKAVRTVTSSYPYRGLISRLRHVYYFLDMMSHFDAALKPHSGYVIWADGVDPDEPLPVSRVRQTVCRKNEVISALTRFCKGHQRIVQAPCDISGVIRIRGVAPIFRVDAANQS